MNNAVLDALKKRRSIRSYEERMIEDEKLALILEAATYAPSAMGRQSATMVVVKDKEALKELSRLNAKVMNSDSDPFYGAPLAVIVFGDTNFNNYVQDASLVMQNLMVSSYSLGIGSCWINRAKEMFEYPEAQKYLKKWGLEDHYEGVAVCILGYQKGETPKAKPRKDNYVIYD